jgi:hypothetical protein
MSRIETHRRERVGETTGVGIRQEEPTLKGPKLLRDGCPEDKSGISGGDGKIGPRKEPSTQPRQFVSHANSSMDPPCKWRIGDLNP